MADDTSFKKSTLSLGNSSENGYFTDPSTYVALEGGYYIEVYHIISKQSVFFKAFLTDFTDNFNVNYNKESVFTLLINPVLLTTHKRSTQVYSYMSITTSFVCEKSNVFRYRLPCWGVAINGLARFAQ